jgi:Thioesterase-like superfamily
VQSAFFEPAGNSAFVATPATAGPWSPDAQHGGPPSALAARALERHEPAEGQRLGRVTVDILRPVPVAKLTVRTRTIRPGRRVALLETVLEADGQEVLHARGWRIAIPDGQVPVIRGIGDAAPPPLPLPDADGQQLAARLPNAHTAGYLSAIEWRFLDGGFEQPAPGRAWTRPRIPLVAGEDASPMCRTLLVADSGSGVSAVLDPARFIFINVDLTVVLPRDPIGEWLLLEAATTTGTQGTGLAETALSDLSGRCGTALQTLLLAPR